MTMQEYLTNVNCDNAWQCLTYWLCIVFDVELLVVVSVVVAVVAVRPRQNSTCQSPVCLLFALCLYLAILYKWL